MWDAFERRRELLRSSLESQGPALPPQRAVMAMLGIRQNTSTANSRSLRGWTDSHGR